MFYVFRYYQRLCQFLITVFSQTKSKTTSTHGYMVDKPPGSNISEHTASCLPYMVIAQGKEPVPKPNRCQAIRVDHRYSVLRQSNVGFS